MSAPRLGSIESGGSKFVCLVGSAPDRIEAETRIPTGRPGPTLARAIDFFRETAARTGPLDALGIASFGPLELRPGHARFGHLAATPKPGWSGVDVAGPFAEALGVPVGIDTDVNGAALGEGRWGAARGLDTYVYLTVGTGIGGGAVIGGKVARGLVHAEMGHLTVPRIAGDSFPGSCPFHGDCWEGLAGGEAMGARWGSPPEELAGEALARALRMEAAYLAAGLRNIVYTVAPQRIVIGGGVAAFAGLFPLLRTELTATLAGYPGLPEHAAEDFVVPARLGRLAGPAGGLVLAAGAAAAARRSPGAGPSGGTGA
ncbi:fructokinase [Streptomyces subrutilus]|uniref:fructokinase n=1 Tax=Streptomyces subrutilus TaxID=36818 RepID=A0A5P2USW1_9ACTN|nr:ROK family protein [Streptomyces subrutilus]QEU82203.1 ROK family protein [Streptomyces subrutilus]GGZ92191.1 fructokinase [Streptomyces subrutilus]